MDLTTVKTLILFVTLASTVAFGVFPMFFVERFRNARWMGTMTSLSTTFSGGVSYKYSVVFGACAFKFPPPFSATSPFLGIHMSEIPLVSKDPK